MDRDVQTFFAPDGLFAADGDLLLRRITGMERENYLVLFLAGPAYVCLFFVGSLNKKKTS